jgi:hypothetical protein
MIPQIILICLYLFGLFKSAHVHGKEKSGKNNFFIDFITVLLMFALLYWGGFFNPILSHFK